VSDAVTSHVRSLNCFFKPGQLFEDFSNFRCSCWGVKNSLGSAMRSDVGSKVHCTLRVTEVRLSAVRWSNVKVVVADD
jgi:hypothetical protein